MKLPLSPICESGRHCTTCRDLAGGRGWRIALTALRIVPEDAPDFTCPRGLAWGYIDTIPRPTRPPLPIVELTDEQIEEERRRLAAGGCCGTPSRA